MHSGDRKKRVTGVSTKASASASASTTNPPYFCKPAVGVEEKVTSSNANVLKRPTARMSDSIRVQNRNMNMNMNTSTSTSNTSMNNSVRASSMNSKTRTNNTATATTTTTTMSRKNPYTSTSTSSSSSNFQFQEVVRGKRAREELLGYDCEECMGFLNAVCNAPGGNVFNRGTLIQRCSRHRAKYRPAETPEGFWDLSFADEKAARKQMDEELMMVDDVEEKSQSQTLSRSRSESDQSKSTQSQKEPDSAVGFMNDRDGRQVMEGTDIIKESRESKVEGSLTRSKSVEEQHGQAGESSQNTNNSCDDSPVEESMAY